MSNTYFEIGRKIALYTGDMNKQANNPWATMTPAQRQQQISREQMYGRDARMFHNRQPLSTTQQARLRGTPPYQSQARTTETSMQQTPQGMPVDPSNPFASRVVDPSNPWAGTESPRITPSPEQSPGFDLPGAVSHAFKNIRGGAGNLSNIAGNAAGFINKSLPNMNPQSGTGSQARVPAIRKASPYITQRAMSSQQYPKGHRF